MAPRRVARHDDPPEIERIVACQPPEVIDPIGDVVKGARPAAPLVSQPPIFQRPRRDAPGSQIGAEVAHVLMAVFGQPAAAMDDDDDGDGHAR